MSFFDQLKEIENTFANDGPLSEHFGEMYQTRPGQIVLAQKWLKAGTTNTHLIAEGPTGCHAKGQGITMFYEPSRIAEIVILKDVEDIIVGDLLMGPDGKPREVLQLIKDIGKMVEISPVTGEPWVVNIDHVLTLVHEDTAAVQDVCIREWLTWNNEQKNSWKLFRVDLDFQQQKYLRTDFTITPAGIDDYYGFTLDRDGRYLLDDFTVTHNSGKSLAYSIPSIMMVQDKEQKEVTRVIIATANIALQEQLYYKDLPLLKKVLFPDLKYGLLKGKSNYLCLQKYYEAQSKIFSGHPDMTILEDWFRDTTSGDKSELEDNLSIWPQVSSTSDECLGKQCPNRENCYAQIAQNEARGSEVIITNFHMLLIAGGGLPKHQLLICDEGHALANVARHALGFTISRRNMYWMKSQLDAMGYPKEAQKLEDALIAFEDYFFRFLGPKYPSKRIESSDDVPNLNGILQPLLKLKVNINLEKRTFEDEGNELEAAKLERNVKRVRTLFNNLQALALCDPSCVFWADKKFPKKDKTTTKRSGKNKGKQQREERINIECRPIDVSAILKSMLFLHTPPIPLIEVTDADGEVTIVADPKAKEEDLIFLRKSVLLISATMTSNDGFSFIRSETGLTKELGEEISVASPFNLKKQGTLIVPETMAPQPKWPVTPDTQGYYYEALADHLQEFVSRCGGRVLALFTSWSALSATLEKASPKIEVPILSQKDGTRTFLVEKFRGMEEGVLAGVDSFWTGVDIPGMQGLFIDKLPFPVPSDPLFAAMSGMYEVQGKHPFFDLSLPLATLKLRQGMGRLIRTMHDEGYAMIADRRLLDKGYGNRVIQALPEFRFIVNLEKM